LSAGRIAMETDLFAELARTRQQRDVMEKLRCAGVPRWALTTPLGINCGFGVDRFDVRQDGTYQLSETGPGAIIMVVMEHNDLADLLAWRLLEPGRWWLRRGLGVFLGEEAVGRAAFLHEPLAVYRSPLSWLRGGCDGAVVLDWRFAQSMLLEVSEIVAEDLAHGEEIERRLRERAPAPPRITVKIGEAA
jgi:hypothetical protein